MQRPDNSAIFASINILNFKFFVSVIAFRKISFHNLVKTKYFLLIQCVVIRLPFVYYCDESLYCFAACEYFLCGVCSFVLLVKRKLWCNCNKIAYNSCRKIWKSKLWASERERERDKEKRAKMRRWSTLSLSWNRFVHTPCDIVCMRIWENVKNVVWP